MLVSLDGSRLCDICVSSCTLSITLRLLEGGREGGRDDIAGDTSMRVVHLRTYIVTSKVCNTYLIHSRWYMYNVMHNTYIQPAGTDLKYCCSAGFLLASTLMSMDSPTALKALSPRTLLATSLCTQRHTHSHTDSTEVYVIRLTIFSKFTRSSTYVTLPSCRKKASGGMKGQGSKCKGQEVMSDLS